MTAETPGRPGRARLWPAVIALLAICLLVPSAAGSGSHKPVITALHASPRRATASTKVGVSPAGHRSRRPAGQWAYSQRSIFNTPIPAHPKLSHYTKTEIAFISTGCNPLIRCLGIEGYGIPAYWATASTPMVKVEVTVRPMSKCGEQVVEMPIPLGAKEEQSGKTIPDRDAPFVVFGANGIEYDAFHMTEPGVAPDGYAEKLKCPATSNWQAEGTSPPNYGTTYWKSVPRHEATSGEFGAYHADRNPYGSGLLTERDFELPSTVPWPHAIAMAAAFTCEGDGHGTAEHTWCRPPRPAHLTSGGCPYLQGGSSQPFTWDGHSAEEVCLPEGARLQLAPASEGGPNCETTSLLSEGWQRQYCKTLQIYGIIIDDTGNTPIGPGMTAVPQASSSYRPGFVPPYGRDCKAEAENPATHRAEKLCGGSAGIWAGAMPRAIMEKMRVLKF